MRQVPLSAYCLVVLAGCSTRDDAPPAATGTVAVSSPRPAITADDSPLTGLVTGEGVGRAGRAVKAAAGFPSSARQIVATADVNGTRSGTVTFTWYREGKDGAEEKLFSQDVAVTPPRSVFSTAVSPGTLASGRYRVEARHGDDTEVAGFTVQGATGGPGAPPRPGPTGTRAPVSSSPSPRPHDDVLVYLRTPDPLATKLEMAIAAFGPTTVNVKVSTAGAAGVTTPVSLRPGVRVFGREVSAGFSGVFDPCDRRLGRDQPGTVFAFDVQPAGQRTVLPFYYLDDDSTAPSPTITLGPDTTDPTLTATFERLPAAAPGDPIERGHRIGFTASADDAVADGQAWQSGVREIVFMVNGVRRGSKLRPGGKPQCSPRTHAWTAPAAGGEAYVVGREDSVTLCLVAVDYAERETRSCRTFTTGAQRYEGTLQSTWRGSVCNGDQRGTITLQVDGDTVTGSSATTGRQDCPSIPFSRGGPQSARLGGTLRDGKLRLDVLGTDGFGDNTSGCWGNPVRPIVLEVAPDGTARGRYQWAFGPEKYGCEIEIRREEPGEPVG